jgi:hypothetical protein
MSHFKIVEAIVNSKGVGDLEDLIREVEYFKFDRGLDSDKVEELAYCLRYVLVSMWAVVPDRAVLKERIIQGASDTQLRELLDGMLDEG